MRSLPLWHFRRRNTAWLLCISHSSVKGRLTHSGQTSKIRWSSADWQWGGWHCRPTEHKPGAWWCVGLVRYILYFWCVFIAMKFSADVYEMAWRSCNISSIDPILTVTRSSDGKSEKKNGMRSRLTLKVTMAWTAHGMSRIMNRQHHPRHLQWRKEKGTKHMQLFLLCIIMNSK